MLFCKGLTCIIEQTNYFENFISQLVKPHTDGVRDKPMHNMMKKHIGTVYYEIMQ